MAADQRGSPAAQSPIERDAQLALLATALDGAGRGVGTGVLIEAPAGLGKTRLLDEAAALADAQGVRVMRARASRSDRDYPFGLVLRLLEPFLAHMPGDDREALFTGSAHLAKPLLSGAGGEEEGRDTAHSTVAVLHGLYWLVLNIAGNAPLVLCLDDVQWADDASLQFVPYLAERIEDSPILLLGAARPRRGGETSALTALRGTPALASIVLASLTKTGMTELVRRSRPHLDAETCAACVDVARGNPFYLREVLLAVDDDLAPGLTPERIRELGTAALARAAVFRLLRLGPRAVALAEALGVLGEQSPLLLVGRLAGLPLPEAGVAADELAAEQLITAGAELEFVHPLIGQSVYAEIPPARRALDHAEAAQLLHDSGGTVERVATQLMAAPVGTVDWATATLRLAAERAIGHGAPRSAVRYLSRAVIEAGEMSPARGDLLVALGRAQTAVEPADAVASLRAAFAEQTDPAQRQEVARLLARALAFSGQHSAAADVLELALDEIHDGTERQRSGLLADYLAYAAFSPDLRQRSIARATPLLRAPPEAASHDDRMVLAALAMRSGQSWAPNLQTITLAERAWGGGALLQIDGPDGTGWLMTVWAYELAEAHAAAQRVCAAATAAASSGGSVDAFAAASYFHGFSALFKGELIEAIADAEQAIEVAGTGRHRYLVPALVLKANVLLERGDLAEADQVLRVADELIDPGRMLDVPWTLDAHGRLALARHQPREALDRFLRAGAYLTDRLAVEHTVLAWRVGAALAALALGEHAQARELVAAELMAADRKQARVARGRATRVRGLLAGGADGLAALTAATEMLADTGAELEYAYALTDLGAALRRAGRRVEARVPLTLADVITARVGGELLGRRVRDELAASGARPVAPPQRRTLTPSEGRVAELAVQGLTNVEIAQALFVSPKTVEYHLRHVYQRLGITRRRELAAAMAAAP